MLLIFKRYAFTFQKVSFRASKGHLLSFKTYAFGLKKSNTCNKFSRELFVKEPHLQGKSGSFGNV